jgi:hypothetical protein
MSKICLINQPAGLGDIFFLQKFVDKKISEGFEVIFPTLPSLIYVRDYIKKDGLRFFSTDEDFPHKGFMGHNDIVKNENLEYYPFHIADRRISGSCMEAKYTLVGEDYAGWQDHFSWTRNLEKENELYYNILGLTDGKDYSLVSNVWGTPPTNNFREVPTSGKYKIVQVKMLDGFTPFDWSKVIENAKEISIVDTSFNYLIEKLNLKSENLYLTSRFTPPDFSHIINIFKKNWIYQN